MRLKTVLSRDVRLHFLPESYEGHQELYEGITFNYLSELLEGASLLPPVSPEF